MGQIFWARVRQSLLVLAVLVQPGSSAPAQTAQRRFIVHDKGLQRMGMANKGEWGNPDNLPIFLPELEYPGDRATIFLFSAGLWVGGVRDGMSIVSVCTDGDNGTNEFAGLEFATEADRENQQIQSIGWLAKSTDVHTVSAQDSALRGIVSTPYGHSTNTVYAHYLGLGRYGVDDDSDGRIDEDPAGDTSCDYQDNDGDGMYDEADPDLDGDLVPGSRDDDGDGLLDEDEAARAPQEYITVYADTCETCVANPDSDGVTPLGVLVVQHSYQWRQTYADDFILYEFEIRNIGATSIQDIAVGMFADFDIGQPWEFGTGYPGGNDRTSYYPETRLAAMYDPPDAWDWWIVARYVGVQWIGSQSTAPVAYANFDNLRGGDPTSNSEKYVCLTSGVEDPPSDMIADWRFLISAGPLGDLEPGESMTVVFALVNGVEEDDLIDHAIYARNMWESGLRGPSAPASPVFTLQPVNRGVEVFWGNNAEPSMDRLTGRPDFQGYRIWRTEDGVEWTLAASYDLPDTIGLNLGWPPPSATSGEYAYRFTDTGLMNGARLRYVVTAFDDGDNGDGINTEVWDDSHDGMGVLESDRLSLLQEVVPAGATVTEGSVDSVYVVPNPYRGSSILDLYGTDGRGVIEFRGLPAVCRIEIYTLAGDLVRKLEHLNGLSWEAWDVRNSENRDVAGGVYLYRITSGGNERIGKFMVIR